MRLTEFNLAADAEARTVLRPCLDIDRWTEALISGRPYATAADLWKAAEGAAAPFSAAEVEQALSQHPRIGERAGGDSAEAELSRAEQGRLSLDDEIQRRLAEGNRRYEEQFGRVFLIRAAGRTSEEILSELDRRLASDPATEVAEVADQLRQIALVRLKGAIEQ